MNKQQATLINNHLYAIAQVVKQLEEPKPPSLLEAAERMIADCEPFWSLSCPAYVDLKAAIEAERARQ